MESGFHWFIVKLQYNVWQEAELFIDADNLEMEDSDPEATLEADWKVSESFLNQSTLQLESSLMCQNMQEQHAARGPRDHLDGKYVQHTQSSKLTCQDYLSEVS